jgi:hypothetical protein
MSNFKLLDNGFLTLKEDVMPISSVFFYETYDNLTELNRLETEKNKYNALLAMI